MDALMRQRQRQAFLVIGRIGHLHKLIQQPVGPEQTDVDRDPGRDFTALGVGYDVATDADFLRDLSQSQVAPQPSDAEICAEGFDSLLHSEWRRSSECVSARHCCSKSTRSEFL